jgi:UDP-N-acetylmuramoylalanine--D-glutamate ligase
MHLPTNEVHQVPWISSNEHFSLSLAMYGKGRVGNAVKELAESVGLAVTLVDDETKAFDPSIFDIVIPTPGASPHKELSSRAYGDNSLSECEFAFTYLPSGFKIISITGTDGKSTTAWILYKLLLSAYWEDQVFLSGNFEIPLSETVKMIREKGLTSGYIVLEVSSFMSFGIAKNLHLTKLLPNTFQSGFISEIAIFTNFAPDHQDWHANMEEYFDAKSHLLIHSKNQLAHTSIQKNALTQSFELWWKNNTTVHWYSGENPSITGGSDEIICTIDETHFRGKHNIANIEVSMFACRLLGIPSNTLRTAILDIHGLPHRLEKVTTANGITFIDDSKSTSAQSLRVALESFPVMNSIILIAWGSDKGDSFDSLAPLVKNTCKYIICMGVTKEKFVSLGILSNIPTKQVENMEEAVQFAWKNANPGDIVLLSPGCASFWLFKNYLERAQKFIQAVISLIWNHE